MISGGFTKYLQPQNIFINMLFKDELKKRYIKYCLDQQNIKAKSPNKIGSIRLHKFGKKKFDNKKELDLAKCSEILDFHVKF